MIIAERHACMRDVTNEAALASCRLHGEHNMELRYVTLRKLVHSNGVSTEARMFTNIH